VTELDCFLIVVEPEVHGEREHLVDFGGTRPR
jgi:hypothetical protein